MGLLLWFLMLEELSSSRSHCGLMTAASVVLMSPAALWQLAGCSSMGNIMAGKCSVIRSQGLAKFKYASGSSSVWKEGAVNCRVSVGKWHQQGFYFVKLYLTFVSGSISH